MLTVILLRRCIEAVLVIFAVSMLSFVLMQFSGDPVEALIGTSATAAEYTQLRQSLGLDASIAEQYVRFAGRALGGDFGVSLQQHRPVSAIIAERLPATLELCVLSVVLGMASGIGLGVLAGARPRCAPARTIMTASLACLSVPTFLLSVMLVWLLSTELRLLPAFGRGETLAIGWWTTGLMTYDGLRSLVLPVITLALYQCAWMARLVAGEITRLMPSAFIAAARARGLPEWRVLFGHALPGIMVPILTQAGMQFGNVLVFAIVTESVFQWPGLGALFVEAIMYADRPVIAAYLMLAALVFIIVGAIVDVAICIADPRSRDKPMERAAP